MKRPIVVLFALLAVFVVCAAGFLVYRNSWSWDALASGRILRNSAEAPFALKFPTAAWPMPDGGYAVLDDEGRRIVRMDAQAVLRWTVGNDGFYGRFLSVDADDKGFLYAIDTGISGSDITKLHTATGPETAAQTGVQSPAIGGSQGDTQTPPLAGAEGDTVRPGQASSAAQVQIEASASGDALRYERVMRIGLDGNPAGVLVQKAFSGTGGFVRGSLRVAGNAAWYLFAGDDGLVSLAKVGLDDGKERVVVKTEWAVRRASIAPDGQDAYIAVGGGLVRWSGGRFEALAEHADELPYPSEARIGPDGALYVSDPSIGVLARIAADGKLTRALDAQSLGTASVRPVGIVFDAFAMNETGYTIVDQSSCMILSVGFDGRVTRMIRSVTLPQGVVARERVAWAFALAAAAIALALAATGVVLSLSRGPAFLSALAAALAVLAVSTVVALAWTSASSRASAAAAEEAAFSRLRAAAVAGASAMDPEAMAAVDSPADYGGPAWDRLRDSLQSVAERSPADGSVPMYAILYRERDGALRFVCDARGEYRPGLPQRYAFPEYRRVLREASPATGIIEDSQGRWLAAMAPVKGPDGSVAGLLELSVPRPEPRALGLSALALAAVAAAFLASFAGFWFLFSARRRRAAESAGTERRGERAASGPYAAAAAPNPAGTLGLAAASGEERPEASPPPDSSQAAEDPERLRARRLNALHLKALARLKAGDAPAAAALLERLVREDPGNVKALNNLGVAYRRAGRAGEALACLERCVALDPGNEETRRNLERVRGQPAP